MATKALKAEVQSDPGTVGYSGMTDQEVFDSLFDTTLGATRNRVSMTGTEVINQIVEADFNGLSTDLKDLVWGVLSLGEINPFGIEKDILVRAFGGSSQTITNLAAARVVAIHRVEELNLGNVTLGSIARAR